MIKDEALIVEVFTGFSMYSLIRPHVGITFMGLVFVIFTLRWVGEGHAVIDGMFRQ